ncbi:diguanylate cyclase/phosphodiesterase [Caballeronia hypogeia]|uniref:Diguanylate cyclase/phosphodiesterase n=1 Tax=Caballeronia hypogeia TaxID=1777140 RepID=A0A157ZEP0_9BURK|nr:GGDEF domain-containing protein [Caballeronia hypogeia]SAK44032.1 diguanylate cyclase/phosphodiesterase [Caballeronia hypogeia]
MSLSLCAPETHAPSIRQLIASNALRAVFQPIVRFADGEIIGYEGLIRGPAGTALESPAALFEQAAHEQQTIALEQAAARACIAAFARLARSGLLFVNFSAAAIESSIIECQTPGDLARAGGLDAKRLVVELTEQSVIADADRFGASVRALRASGSQFALDDYGSANASMNLWVRLAPHYVKIDRFFVADIARDPLKFEAVKAMVSFANASGALLIAEGIETQADLEIVRDLGIACAQGYLLGRPAASPDARLPEPVANALRSGQIAVYPARTRTSATADMNAVLLERMLVEAPALTVRSRNDDVVRLFNAMPLLHAVAIVDDGRPVALINRRSFMDQYALPYHREVFGKRPCMQFANVTPLVVERGSTLEQIARLFASDDQRDLSDGFIVTDNGRYVGLGTGASMVRAVTEVRVEAARYANPLTFLPGNVPLNSHIDRLVAHGSAFVACYFDLDHFKPFNDRYGYWQGDEVLKATANTLASVCEPTRDFLGHVGGDDFLLLFQSDDWRERIEQAIAAFNELVKRFYAPEERLAGGILGTDRLGRPTFFGFVRLSAGAVCIEAGAARGSAHVSTVAAVAKRWAKEHTRGFAVLELAEFDTGTI